ncbi:Ig-like domain-containing protein [Rhizobium alvei]|uniref:RapA2 cadherin-like domain-containing protein n=1 Tax=Rhizobium alvei TaxID=1132659 RepID=A0ABT8YTA3_9HYPH|nr:hypothetical protein [Rhizobium alvei]MDO6966579.1 hypothetical protein [Rhizobium alvei]
MSSYSSIAALVATGTTAFDLDDGDELVLTVEEAQTLVASGVTFASGDAVGVTDLAANIEELTESEISELGALGVTTVLGSDRQLGLTLTQLAAYSTETIAINSEYATYSETSAEIAVNTATAGYEATPDLTILSDGSYVLSWRSNVSGDNEVHAQIYDANGNAVGNNLVLNNPDYNFGGGKIVALSDGGFAVYWAEYTAGYSAQNIYAIYYDGDGNAQTGQIAVSTASGYKNDLQAILLNDGSLAFSWSNSSSVGYTQLVNAAGVLVGGENQIASSMNMTNYGSASIALPDGSFVVSYGANDGDGYEIFFQIVDATGNDVGTPVQVNVYETGRQSDPAVTALANGGFVIVWGGEYDTDAEGIHQRVYDSSGNPLTGEILVAETTVDAESLSVIALTGGGFVTIWTDYVKNAGESASYKDVLMTVYDADGNAVSDQVTVNSWLTGTQDDYNVTTLPDGGFVVTWVSNSSADGEDGGVFLQVFDANGDKVGDETHVNDYTTAAQSEPVITTFANGDFVISWSSFGQDGAGYGIYQKRYTHDTEVVSLTDSRSHLSALTVADVGRIADYGVTKITVSDGGAVTFKLDTALALLDIDGLVINGEDSITLTDTSSAFEALTATEIAALAAAGYTSFDVSDDTVSLDHDQLDAVIQNGITFADGDEVYASLSMAELKALDDSATGVISLATLGSLPVAAIDLTDDSGTISGYFASQLLIAGLKFVATDTVTLYDTGNVLVSLGGVNLSFLKTLGVTRMDASNDTIFTSYSDLTYFLEEGFSYGADDQITIFDWTNGYETLTAAEIADLAAAGVTEYQFAAATIKLSFAQLEAFSDQGISLTFDTDGGTLTLYDTSAVIETLDTDSIAMLASMSIATINLSDNAATLSLDQIVALNDRGLGFDAGDTITVSLSVAEAAALETTDISEITTIGASVITSDVAELELSAAQLDLLSGAGVAIDDEIIAVLSGDYSTLDGLSASALDAYEAAGVDIIELAASASVITGLSIGDVVDLGDKDVTRIDVTEDVLTITNWARATLMAVENISFASGDLITVSVSASKVADSDSDTLAILTDIKTDRVDISDTVLEFTYDLASQYAAAGLSFLSADEITATIGLSSALALTADDTDDLFDANVDELVIEADSDDIADLSVNQIAALGAAGITGIDLSDDAIVLSSAQKTALDLAGITFDNSDDLSIHQAPTVVNDSAKGLEGNAVTVAVLANDTAHDDLSLSVETASVGKGSGTVTINSDGTLTVRYTGPDIDGNQSAKVTVLYGAGDGIETTEGKLTVTFQAVTETLTGSGKNDKITGGAYGERIEGLGGNDRLFGLGGGDTIVGGQGNDTIIGGEGSDILTGNQGADRFLFNSVAEMGTKAKTADRITDFDNADLIVLSAIDANTARSGNQAFTFIGTKSFSGTAGELQATRTDDGYLLSVDTNGDGKGDGYLHLLTDLTLNKQDFSL